MALSTLYHVFLSFRGIDTRRNFTDHLYRALCRKDIITFRDDKLPRGKEISQTLLKIIEESKISIVIFSENYAQSNWCLEELVKIMECKVTTGQEVFPIFHNVNPSDVRKQMGKFGAAFEQVKSNSDRIHRWKTALTEASNLTGWDSSNYRHEADLCEEVADYIMEKVYCSCSSASAGLDSQLCNKRSRELGKDAALFPSWKTSSVWLLKIYKNVFYCSNSTLPREYFIFVMDSGQVCTNSMGRRGTICRLRSMELPCYHSCTKKHPNQRFFLCHSWQENCQSSNWIDLESSINQMYATEVKTLQEELEREKTNGRKLKEEKATLMEGMKKMENEFRVIKITVITALGIFLLSMKFVPVV